MADVKHFIVRTQTGFQADQCEAGTQRTSEEQYMKTVQVWRLQKKCMLQ